VFDSMVKQPAQGPVSNIPHFHFPWSQM